MRDRQEGRRSASAAAAASFRPLIERVRLPTQIYVPRPSRAGPPTRDALEPITHFDHWKPAGGLWTSTYATAWQDGWPGWCHYEQPDWLDTTGYLLEPVEALVLNLDTVDRALGALDLYGRPIIDRPSFGIRDRLRSFDWLRLVDECSAVRCSGIVQSSELRFGDSLVWNSWDCESTVWFRWAFEGEPVPVVLDPPPAVT